MGAALIAVLAFLALSQASPLPVRVKYDQKQEGKWNVRADLENFVILVIPTSSPGSAGVSNASLLDFLSKTIPLPYHKFSKKHVKVHQEDVLPDTEQFLESKTAPYHVDISRTRSHLAKLHPEVNIPKEEIIIARSPSVALAKHLEGSSSRNSRAILITVPVGNENVQMQDIKAMLGKMDEKKKLGLSAQAIEQGLAEQYQNGPGKKWEGLHISEPMEELERKAQILIQRQEIAKKTSPAEYEKLTKEVRTAYATIIAKAIQASLVDYFKKVAIKLKEQNQEAATDSPMETDLPEKEKVQEEKAETQNRPKGVFTQKIMEIYDKILANMEKGKGKVEAPKLELQPPKVEAEGAKSKEEFAGKKGGFEYKVGGVEKANKKPIGGQKDKDELLLLGAVNEQCGPGMQRDPSGICVTVKS